MRKKSSYNVRKSTARSPMKLFTSVDDIIMGMVVSNLSHILEQKLRHGKKKSIWRSL